MGEFRDRVRETIKSMQAQITESLENIEEVPFIKDHWRRPDDRGGGQSNIIQRGKVFEKGGVNVTELEVPLSASLARYLSEKGRNIDYDRISEYAFYAVGVSLVIHPWNPYVPTIHANYRYIEISDNSEVFDWWFAGGSDLTPYYINREDIELFHSSLKEACDQLSPDFYPKYKKVCDDYFRIQHRNFARGVGGIFFDDITQFDKEELLAHIQRCADAFVKSYPPTVVKRKDQEFGKRERKWQKIRRGHYVEFNLCYDRGTKVGLITPDANIEAIFMPMPLNACWEYKYTPEDNSPEAEILEVLKNPIDWVN